LKTTLLKSVPALLGCMITTTLHGQSVSTQTLTNHVVPALTTAQDLGPANPDQQIQLQLFLQSRNQAALDSFVEAVHTEGSPLYHRFLTPQQFRDRFGQDQASIAKVQQFAARNGLRVASTAPDNLSITVTAPLRTVQKVFSVQIDNFRKNGVTFRANTTDPRVDASVAPLIAGIGGLAQVKMKPHHVAPVSPEGIPFKPRPLSATPQGAFFSPGCIYAPETHTFTGGGVTATYVGNRYGAKITNTQPGTLPPCGYSPQDVYAGYNLGPMYQNNLKGAGQTIVIVDAFGSTTIRKDLALFSQVYGLPPANLQIIGTPVPPTNDNIAGWAAETTLDVEWAHAIAPAAKIVLEIAPTNEDTDLYNSIQDAIVHHRGTVISNSYGSDESLNPPAARRGADQLFQEGVAIGINNDFSTGDDGDEADVLGYTDVQYPASSLWVTAIGGTSLALNVNRKRVFQSGWGNNLTRVVDGATGNTLDPPAHLGFQFGAGGGQSNVYPKPSFQKVSGVPGVRRQTPDIGWLADPYTGVEIIQTVNGSTVVEVIGGTSLACPMFSAIWAIANQDAHTTIGLGQAARILYRLPGSAIEDVVPVGSGANVRGVVKGTTDTYLESPSELATPLANTNTFYSALYNSPFSKSWYVITFGTDSTLTTRKGWDHVTGLGTPKGLAFVNAVASKK
jgi:subtilase family serine protease